MTAKVDYGITGLFDQAVESFGEAIKSGVKIQEEVAKWWTDAFDQAGPVADWQKRAGAVLSEAIPTAQKSAEQWLRLLEQNYQRSVELIKKAFESENPATIKDAQNRTRELWEATVEVVRTNAQALAQTHVQVIEAWAGLFRKNMNGNGAAHA